MGTGITGKNVKVNSYISKDLMPGIVEARIVGLAVVKKEKPYNKDGFPEYDVQISLEGPSPEPGFEGWAKDNNNPAKGCYKGPFKLVKHDTWSIKKFTFKSKKPADNGKEITISAEEQILGIMQEIAEAFGKPKLFSEQQYQKEFASWSDYIKQMNMDLQFSKHYVWWCLAGSKSKNAKGYVVYYLNLPDRKMCNHKPRIALKKEDVCDFMEEMIYVNQKSFNENSSTPTRGDDDEVTDEDFNTEGVDTDDADFGASDIGSMEGGDEELFEGAGEFDEDAF